MAWLSTWKYRMKMTAPTTRVSANLTNYPFKLRLSSDSGMSDSDLTIIFDELTSDANRKKIAITTDDGTTQCNVEIVYWSDALEKALLYVKSPALSFSANTDLYIYYDVAQDDNNTYVGDTGSAPAQAVWDTNYMCVLHMVEQGNGTADEYKDSTSNGNHAVGVATKCPTLTLDSEGMPCQDFEGNGTTRRDRMIIPDDDTLSMPTPGGITVEGMLAPDKASFGWNYAAWLTKGRGDDTTSEWKHFIYALDGYGGAEPRFGWNNWYICDKDLTTQPGSDFRDAWTLNAWMHVVGVSTCTDSHTGTIKIYRDGVESYPGHGTRGTYATPFEYENCSHEVRIGYYDAGNNAMWYPGLMREIRISNIERSAAWIRATYYSEIDDFLLFSLPETLVDGDESFAVVANAASPIYPTVVTLNGIITQMGTGANEETSLVTTFEYGLTTGYGTSVTADESPMTEAGNCSKQITGLLIETTYHFRVKCVGDLGTYYSGDYECTTASSIATVRALKRNLIGMMGS